MDNEIEKAEVKKEPPTSGCKPRKEPSSTKSGRKNKRALDSSIPPVVPIPAPTVLPHQIKQEPLPPMSSMPLPAPPLQQQSCFQPMPQQYFSTGMGQSAFVNDFASLQGFLGAEPPVNTIRRERPLPQPAISGVSRFVDMQNERIESTGALKSNLFSR